MFDRKDCILHQYISYIIYTICFAILYNITSIDVAIVISTVITIGIGMFKEQIIDYRIRGKKAEKEDFVSDLIGTGLALLTSLIFLFR